ncbi:UNVERIFIED_CONTAM: Retrovirus-related Pol polyprotein from transposon TNT 1-94 [Sesamum calycinum]|uniref:Retrovirus-related Pol polyprotein from transposon TNT 1-94 n=1 Tax=Sesamum calycinum TaxID=2727403 RepID=A0AAW2J5N2_9LAMI
MALVAHLDLELHQMDVKTAVLNGDIDEMIYMMQPENFVSGDPKNMICRIKKSIYGLKQASRQWYFKFHQVIISFGFEMNVVDDCVYHKFCGSKQIFLVLYVDDILLANNDIGLLHETKRFLAKNFEMKDLGEASYVLGLYAPGYCIHYRDVGQIFEQSKVKSLDSSQKGLKVLTENKDYMLTYRRTDQIEIIGYTESHFAGCQDSMKSTSGYIYMLAEGAISWKSAKQSLIASSVMAAEFIACYEASNQGIWL